MEENNTMLLEIPEELENLKLPSLLLIEQYKDIKNRKIYVTCDIDETLVEATRLIMNYNAEDRGKSVEDRKTYLCIYSEFWWRFIFSLYFYQYNTLL